VEKVAVITGASSGIGLLTTLELASKGYRVVATMRDLGRRTSLDEAAAKTGVSSQLDIRQLDITDFDSVPAAVQTIIGNYGRIDLLVNNAGFAMAGFAEDVRLKDLRAQFDTNFFGHVNMTKAVLPTMRAQRSGHIIMISSVSGRAGQPGVSSYAASKFALEGWSEALRIEMKPLGINVVLVEPGAFKTDIWDRNVRIPPPAISEISPNRERVRKYAEFVQNEIVKRDAREVARLIARIAMEPEPRLRYMIGNDAFGQLLFRAILPWKIYERIVARKMGID
jgi:NAD(P)-dependent dehydrogenase (short-subunit alcohol dehydrogenase family)